MDVVLERIVAHKVPAKRPCIVLVDGLIALFSS